MLMKALQQVEEYDNYMFWTNWHLELLMKSRQILMKQLSFPPHFVACECCMFTYGGDN